MTDLEIIEEKIEEAFLDHEFCCCGCNPAPGLAKAVAKKIMPFIDPTQIPQNKGKEQL